MKKNFPRRYFLKGSGAVLAAPVLESLISREARAQMMPNKRLLFMFQDNGNLRDEWAPSAGPYQLPYVLSGLESVKQHVNVVAGIDNHVGLFHSGNGHDIANSTLLTAINRSDAPNIVSSPNAGGPSIDQVIANALPAAPRKSININMPGGVFAISYENAGAPAGSIGAGSAFNNLFANFMGTTSPAVRERRKKTKESVIDAVMENFRHVNTRVSIDDKKKLDHHLTTLRDLETRLALEAQGAACDLGTPIQVMGGSANTQALAYMYSLAFSCGLSHVGSFMMPSPNYETGFPVKYSGGDYHVWIHQGPDYGLDPVRKREDWRASMKWHSEQFRMIIEKFRDTPDVSGTSLLDNSVLVWANVFGTGFNHDYYEIPVVMAGRAGGKIQTGRFLDYRNARASNPTQGVGGGSRYVNQTTNNLWLSISQAMGVPLSTFGTSSMCTGGLPGLVAQ